MWFASCQVRRLERHCHRYDECTANVLIDDAALAHSLAHVDISRPNEVLGKSGPYFYADVTDRSNLERLVVDHDISWVVHNSGILSAKYASLARESSPASLCV